MNKLTAITLVSLNLLTVSSAGAAEKIELLCVGTFHSYSDGGAVAPLPDDVLIIDLESGTAKYDGIFEGDFEVTRETETSIVISSQFDSAYGKISGTLNRYSGELFLSPPASNGKIDAAADLVCKPARRLF